MKPPWISLCWCNISKCSFWNTFCCKGNEKGQRYAFEVFLNATLGVCRQHDMIPRRALVIEGLTALPFSINVDDRMGTGDTSLSSHCPITAPSQQVEMTSVTVPCWYVCPRKKKNPQPVGILNLCYFFRLFTIKVSREAEQTSASYQPLSTSSRPVVWQKNCDYSISCLFTLDHSMSSKAFGI